MEKTLEREMTEDGKLVSLQAIEKKSGEILDRLKNLEIESLLKEIRKVKLKISLLFGDIIFRIIIAIVSLFLK